MGTFIVSNFTSTDTNAPKVLSAYASDTFNRATSESPGKTETGEYAWAASYGSNNTASIVNKTLKLSNTSGGGTVQINDGRTDGVLSAQLVEFTKFSGLVFRGSSIEQNNGYIFYADAGAYRFARKSGPDSYSDHLQIPNSPVPAAGDVLAVTLKGSTITMAVNGVAIHTLTDGAHIGTMKGLFARATTSRFDNFRWDQGA